MWRVKKKEETTQTKLTENEKKKLFWTEQNKHNQNKKTNTKQTRTKKRKVEKK